MALTWFPYPGLDQILEPFLKNLESTRTEAKQRSELVAEYQARMVQAASILFYVCLVSAIVGSVMVIKVLLQALAGFRKEYQDRVRGVKPLHPELGPTEASFFPGILFSISIVAPL